MIVSYLYLSLSCLIASAYVYPPTFRRNFFLLSREWYRSPEEIVIEKETKDIYPPGVFSFFDTNYESQVNKNEIYSLSKLSLKEISEAYHFSLDYLGDFVVQMGCSPPIDVHENLNELLSQDQICILLEALNSLDPLGQCNDSYRSL